MDGLEAPESAQFQKLWRVGYFSSLVVARKADVNGRVGAVDVRVCQRCVNQGG